MCGVVLYSFRGHHTRTNLGVEIEGPRVRKVVLELFCGHRLVLNALREKSRARACQAAFGDPNPDLGVPVLGKPSKSLHNFRKTLDTLGNLRKYLKAFRSLRTLLELLAALRYQNAVLMLEF